MVINQGESTGSVVEYFESGCICISEGSLKKADPQKTNLEKEDYYIANCSCSRNFKHLLGN